MVKHFSNCNQPRVDLLIRAKDLVIDHTTYPTNISPNTPKTIQIRSMAVIYELSEKGQRQHVIGSTECVSHTTSPVFTQPIRTSFQFEASRVYHAVLYISIHPFTLDTLHLAKQYGYIDFQLSVLMSTPTTTLILPIINEKGNEISKSRLSIHGMEVIADRLSCHFELSGRHMKQTRWLQKDNLKIQILRPSSSPIPAVPRGNTSIPQHPTPTSSSSSSSSSLSPSSPSSPSNSQSSTKDDPQRSSEINSGIPPSIDKYDLVYESPVIFESQDPVFPSFAIPLIHLTGNSRPVEDNLHAPVLFRFLSVKGKKPPHKGSKAVEGVESGEQSPNGRRDSSPRIIRSPSQSNTATPLPVADPHSKTKENASTEVGCIMTTLGELLTVDEHPGAIESHPTHSHTHTNIYGPHHRAKPIEMMLMKPGELLSAPSLSSVSMSMSMPSTRLSSTRSVTPSSPLSTTPASKSMQTYTPQPVSPIATLPVETTQPPFSPSSTSTPTSPTTTTAAAATGSDKKKKTKPPGTLLIHQCYIIKAPSLLDYLPTLSIRMSVAIDFTASNDASQLHKIYPDHYNQYELSMLSVGNVIMSYSDSTSVYALGYGGVVSVDHQHQSTHHAFPITLSTGQYFVEFDDLINIYRRALKFISPSGPTFFHEVIQSVARMASEPFTSDAHHYSILLIITDGVINDLEETIDAIVHASTLPMSIIVVGVGHADFGPMAILDGDDHQLINSHGTPAVRDIVQFVPLREMTIKQHPHHTYLRQASSLSSPSSPSHGMVSPTSSQPSMVELNLQSIAKATLTEIPDHILSFYKFHNIPPLPVDESYIRFIRHQHQANRPPSP